MDAVRGGRTGAPTAGGIGLPLALLVPLILLILLALPSPAAAWTPETQAAIAERAASIAPPDLRRQIARHAGELRKGALAPFREGREERHFKNGDGSGELDAAILAEAGATIEAIRAHRPFFEIVYRLGVVSHFLADANNPLNTSAADPGEGRYFADYARYVESARPRFSVVFYGGGRALEGGDPLPGLVGRALARGRALYPSIGAEYRRVGAIRGVELFDDRSTAFGVGSLAFSHAVSDVAAVMRYVWLAAGGADPRRLPLASNRAGLPGRPSRGR